MGLRRRYGGEVPGRCPSLQEEDHSSGGRCWCCQGALNPASHSNASNLLWAGCLRPLNIQVKLHLLLELCHPGNFEVPEWPLYNITLLVEWANRIEIANFGEFLSSKLTLFGYEKPRQQRICALTPDELMNSKQPYDTDKHPREAKLRQYRSPICRTRCQVDVLSSSYLGPDGAEGGRNRGKPPWI